jgi:histidyl-tRNA synthetase
VKPLIEARLLKGFRDFLPETEIVRKSIINKFETVFEQFGFVPIDTPAIEYADILLGKSGGETEKQIYTFLDQGERQVALRFDLTVPFARFLAQHRHELPLPFKRYHIAKSWRGEKPQDGRYREFMQCDFDIVGVNTASADLEILLVMYRSFKALGLSNFRVHFSHRGVFNDFLAKIGASQNAVDVLRLVDKSKKIGLERTREDLVGLVGADRADRIIDFIAPSPSLEAGLANVASGIGRDNEHYLRLAAIVSGLGELGVISAYMLDLAITRGLDYYTALVFETFIDGAEHLGSVCSGGRYDNLVGLYSTEALSGIGAAIGLDRLLAVLESIGQLPSGKGKTQVFIPVIDAELTGYYHKLAEMLRSEGLRVEVFHEKKKLAAQFTYAEKKGIPYAVLAGGREREQQVVQVRDFSARQNFENLSLPEAIVKLKSLLSV